MSKQKSKYVTLTPDDLFLLSINMGANEEYKAWNIQQFGGKEVEVALKFYNDE